MRRWLVLAAFGAASLLVGPAPAAVAAPVEPGVERLAPGVTLRSVDVATPRGTALAWVTTVDLRNPLVRVGLLHADAVAQRTPLSQMMLAQRAVAGANGDFFNISETHPGVTPTDSAVGPEVVDGVARKANVPDGQRFGPAMPAGTSTHDVFGVGVDRRARVGSLDLSGHIVARNLWTDLDGFNQYALPVGGIGVYTHAWGARSRARAACGTDTDRAAPCTTETAEVTVDRGIVRTVGDTPGAGPIEPGTQVLVGREEGAVALRGLRPGDPVWVAHRLAGAGVPFDFAVGGFPILRGGAPLAGLDDTTRAVRSAAGASADGRTVHLVALDGRASASVGLTIRELADFLAGLGAADAVNLDGGGSSELATREPGGSTVTVRNSPSGGAERPVPNGVGVFFLA